MIRALLLLLALAATTASGTAAAAGEAPGFDGLLDAHNALRQPLGLKPLRWSDEGALQAQIWAEQLARESCVARYNPDENRRLTWGQNVLRVTASGPYEGWRRNAGDVVRRWGEEAQQYDHASHRCRMNTGTQCGQYLQMIWETTEEVGCGRARCTAGEVWVCNYRPRGLQEGLKPYGNPAEPPPVSQAAPTAAATELVMGPFECSAVPSVAPGAAYPQSPVPGL